LAAAVQQLCIQLREAGNLRDRHQEVPAGIADQPFDLALVVALARPPEAVGEEIVGLQLAEHPGPLPPAIAQDTGDGELGVVVQNRPRHAAEEGEGRIVAIAKRFRRLRRIGLHEAAIAVRQVHGKEVDLPLHPTNDGNRFAEVDLCVTRIVPQRHEHLLLPPAALVHVVLHDRDPAGITVLVAQPLEDPLRGVPLLRRPSFIFLQDAVDDPDERIQLRPHRRLAPPISRRHRERQHLRHRPRVYAKPPRRLPLADPLNKHCSPNLRI
jgi:hypothetical protein